VPTRIKTGGRRRGAKNKRTLARERATAEANVKVTDALGADAFEGDAHAFLTAVYRNPALPMNLRVDAAKAAIGYEKPRLASVEGRVENRVTLDMLVAASYE
jgi:hypothetical protein